MVNLYARITEEGCIQLLNEHLLGVANKAIKVIKRPPLRTVIISLLTKISEKSRHHSIRGDELERGFKNTLYLSGLFHDIGKVLWRYQKNA